MNKSFLFNTTAKTQLNTTSSVAKPCPSLVDTEAKKISLVAGYCLVMGMSFIGNILVIVIVYQNQSMRTATNILIVNMSISDLVFPLFNIPLNIYHSFEGPYWAINGIFAVVCCKLSHYLVYVSITVSIFTMIAIAFDRFFAVLFPFKAKLRTSRSRVITIIVIWLLSFVIYIREFVRFELLVHENKSYCVYTAKLYSRQFQKIFEIITFIGLFVIPFLALMIMYGLLILRMKFRKPPGNQTDERAKREASKNKRVVYMSVTVVIVFLVFVSPRRFLDIMTYFRRGPLSCWSIVFSQLAHFMLQSSCAINPLIYFMFSDNFRQGLVRIFRCFKKRNVVGVENDASRANRGKRTLAATRKAVGTRPS